MRTRHALPALVLLVVAAAHAPAADVPIVGDTLVPANKMVRLSVALPTGAAVIWDVFPDQPGNVADTDEAVPGRLTFTGPPGRYTVKARVLRSTGTALSIDTGSVVVTIGQPPPPTPNPNPGPGPGPPPPPAPALPADLLAAVQAAWTAEPVTPTRAADVRNLSAAFRSAAAAVAGTTAPTRGAWITAAHDLVARQMGEPNPGVATKLPGLRRAVGNYLNAALGTGSADPMTPDLKARHAAAYAAVADCLDTLR